jgi:(p)ppGpp synthase/HD superfamily hydrolase
MARSLAALDESNVKLSPKFEEALVYATQIHGGQLRKKTQVPYIAHLLGVTAIAMEYGANETEAIAALLHDAVEDCGGAKRQREIEEKFGYEVGEIVAGCTDTDQTPKPPWRERKENYLAHLKTASASTRLVSAADKLHNARAILHNLREEGEDVWERFNAGKEGALWYYRALVSAFREHGTGALVDELDRVVSELERLSRSSLFR